MIDKATVHVHTEYCQSFSILLHTVYTVYTTHTKYAADNTRHCVVHSSMPAHRAHTPRPRRAPKKIIFLIKQKEYKRGRVVEKYFKNQVCASKLFCYIRLSNLYAKRVFR